MGEEQAIQEAGQGARGRPCSVAAALGLVGEKWSLLAIREISFGNRRFDAIARHTGAPPRRYEYELTDAGRELRPVLTALRAWGDKWAVDAPPAAFTHSCG